MRFASPRPVVSRRHRRAAVVAIPVALAGLFSILAVPPAQGQSADLLLIETASANTVVPGNNVTFNIITTNLGPASATGVRLTSTLSRRSAFISVTSSQGACGHTNGVVTCNLGTLSAGAKATVALTVRAAQGTNFVSSTVTANESDPSNANNSAFQSAAAITALPPFSNPESIILPGGDPLDPGPGSVYPSSVQVSGVTNAVFKATVTVRNINHTWPDDIDLLLVGPGGRNVMLMSDCGLDNGATDVTITFDDGAAASVPTSDPGISSGTFRPTNDGTLDDLPPPAPVRPFGTTLGVFKDTDPNGTWSLYAVDDSPENSGYITDGWTLNLTVGDPIADLTITQTGPSGPVFVGTNIVYTLSVTNRGPAITFATVQDILPASQSFVSATSTRGSCVHNAGTVTCNLGDMLVGQNALITLTVVPISGATATNTVTVAGSQFDLSPTNNTASFVTSSIGISDLAVGINGTPDTVLVGQPTSYSVVVTNLGPNSSDGITMTNRLPANFVALSATPSQGSCTLAAGIITCSLGMVASNGIAAIQVSVQPLTVGTFTNRATVGTAGVDTVPANNVATTPLNVVPAADFALGTAFTTTNLFQGQTLVSVFVITNRGPSGGNAQFSNPFTPNLTFLSASTSHGACTNSGTSLECALGSLFNTETAIVTVACRTLLPGPVTNFATVTGAVADPVSTNNAAMVTAAVTPSTDIAVLTTDSPDPLWLGEDLRYRMVVTNLGAGTAAGIRLTNAFPSSFTFVSATTTQGACTNSGSEISCDLGSLTAGLAATVQLVVHPTAVGTYTAKVNVTAADFDPVLSNNSSSPGTRIIRESGIFGTPFAISIPEFGAGSPYPSTVFVSGLTSAVYHLRVTLTNLTHTYPDDLDLLLVGPQGQAVLLMSDCGGDVPVSGVNLNIDDGASDYLPDGGTIVSGSYRPTNYEINPDAFIAPAPGGAYATNLAAFRNTDPNGTWSLYVFDDAAKDSGVIAGGWGLTFYTQDPLADVGVTQSVSANPAPLAGALLLSYVVTNLGPTLAHDVRVTNTPPAGLQGISFSTSQGSCGNFGGTWICSLGNIPVGGTATINVQATPVSIGQLANTVTVGAAEIDAHPANNVTTLFLTVEQPPFITTNPLSIAVTNGASAQFSAAAGGTGPLYYQWQRNGINLPNATNASLILASVAPSNSGTYRLFVTNRVGSAFSASATLTVQGPPFISDLPNRTINENSGTGQIPFVLTDAESPADSITLTRVSSDPLIVPVSRIVLGGTGTNRNVAVTPLPNQYGVVTISLIATDPDGNSTTNSFVLTVERVIDPPEFVGITRDGETVMLSFTTELGFSYVVEYKDSLDEVDWIPFRTIDGTGGVVTVNDALAISQTRFYRARSE